MEVKAFNESYAENEIMLYETYVFSFIRGARGNFWSNYVAP